VRPILHSVLLITLGSRKYVLDPSGEQYGIPPRDLFLPFREYKKRYMVPLRYWAGRARWTRETQAWEPSHLRKVSREWMAEKQRVEAIFSMCLGIMRQLDQELGGSGGDSLGVVFDWASSKYEDKVGSLRAKVMARYG